ncbi:class I mannose-6-phosphate isomerase [Altererythrobacter sp. KTW20L]|uniref:class I mannose-6-phosphate isomerase n=1 Tax=Altererythrobacter sp. KTW20L TaxID=2942210 RepID=UPI0020BE936B|nr:class I mannose-6-phosphate isomerase [Altererythrobacter sp. KTW20L]MCL6251483.1 class I mannose-6-phosphate isomerase [Altererythrobacter sp. KTW20L]
MILLTRTVEKPWGRAELPAPFTGTASTEGGERIGEIWFEPPPELPQLLVKYIFTSEKLSVQVHPSDAQTQADGLGRQGKEECWLVIDAQPGARLGVGFAEAIDGDAMRSASLDGSIEQLLAWHEVAPGDFFYIPAGTVHAIGGGVSIIEIQQNSDITYRLYDYGRPRELHLDAGIAVARGQPHDPALRRHLADSGNVTLVDGPHFVLDRVEGPLKEEAAARYPGALLVIPLAGDVVVAGEPAKPGQCALAASLAEVQIDAAGQCLLAAPGQAPGQAAARTG